MISVISMKIYTQKITSRVTYKTLSVDESEICIHLAHLLQPDFRHGWGPNFPNSNLKTLREYGSCSMGLVSLNSETVHGMNEMNKNEHFC